MVKSLLLSSLTRVVCNSKIFVTLPAFLTLIITGVFSEQYGTVFATPGVAEKGSMNVEISVAAPGGHSSIPPDHTVSVV